MKHLLVILFFYFLICFETLGQGTFNVYYGNLHSHTDYSGGVGNPRRAFIYARDTAHLDFLAVTDHLEGIYYSSYEWDSTKIMADEVTVNGSFVGIAGYEWTSPTFNHCNVYNTPNKVSPNNLNDWNAFVQSVVNELPAFAQFNHPGLTGSNGWNSLAYMGTLPDSVFALMEINSAIQEIFYPIALDSGWHVSPANGQDNHNADWGTMDDGRTGIWADQLSRIDLFDAIKEGRTFATFDKNAFVWLDINGNPMGSRIPYSSSVPIHIVLGDTDAETWDHIYLVGANTQIFLNISDHPAALDTTITINPAVSKWIYLRAEQLDGQNIYSAPFYFNDLPVAESAYTKDDFILSVYPNPINVNSIIKFNLDQSQEVSLKIIDVSGREVAAIVSGTITAGMHQYSIPFEKMKEGIYFLKYSDDNHSTVLKLIR
jgi:hypothetical protein